ncbi:hypothetical protein [Devosia elaeis]|uniref:hypothetical protein n=1 Tax=Devosia elaeis TaxID=1770058 RepID=UPI00082E1827|nr:hypothetical protein [Devosia elaeis]
MGEKMTKITGVTDEMVERACQAYGEADGTWNPDPEHMRRALETALPSGVTDDWIRDTAMNVMLATEVEEAVRILEAALSAIAPTQAPQPAPDAEGLEAEAWLVDCFVEPVVEFFNPGDFAIPLVRQSEAQAIIEKLRAEIEAAENYLRDFLTAFVTEHFPNNESWKPLPDLLGMLSQMDNASTVARDYKARLAEAVEMLTTIVEAYDDCTGAEPSQSVLDRTIDLDARTFLQSLGKEGEMKMTLHDKIAADVSQIARDLVWCRECGRAQRVDGANALRHGWPKCCGRTMTIDHPSTWEAGELAGAVEGWQRRAETAEAQVLRLTEEKEAILAWFDGLTPNEMHEAIKRDKARIKALEAALRPFAKYTTADGEGFDDEFFRIDDDHPLLGEGLGDNWRPAITVGDMRRARSVLHQENADG